MTIRQSDLEAAKRNSSLSVVSGVGFNVGFVAYNTQHGPLGNTDVRRTLDMAIDKPSIIKAVFAGNAAVAHNPMPPAQWSYNNQLKDAPFDPERAKALLSKAGFRNGLELSLWAMPVQRPYNSNAQLMAHPAFNALIVKARSTSDVQERSKLYEQA